MYSHHKNYELRCFLKYASRIRHFNVCQNYNELDEMSFGRKQNNENVLVFDLEKMEEIVKKHSSRSNLAQNHKRYISYLADTAGYLNQVHMSENIFIELDKIETDFPNFYPVVGFYREQIALAFYCGQGVFNAQPLLIAGEPGVGKTAFCHRLAQKIGTYFSLISFSSMSAGFVLGGMSSNWADGKPGKVVEALAKGRKANPILLLDEIDKAGGDNRYDPLGALYHLLEKETAASFIDEGLELSVDCSRIVWVATANDLVSIPAPIISRFTVIEVDPPDEAQMEKILNSIYFNVRQQNVWGHRFNENLSEEVRTKIISNQVAPRLIQRELIRACGRAVLRERANDEICENTINIRAEDFFINPLSVEKESRPIGFVY